MKPWLKYLLYLIAAAILTIWVLALVRNCGGSEEASPSVTSMENSGITEEEINLESLIEEEEASFSDELDFQDPSAVPDQTADEPTQAPTGGTAESTSPKADESTQVPTDEEERPSPPKTTAPSTPSTTGDYMVIVGNFVVPTNAEKLMRKLRGMGYDGAEVVVFDFSEYHTVIAGRYSSRSQAEKVRNALRRKGFRDAYVHKKKQ